MPSALKSITDIFSLRSLPFSDSVRLACTSQSALAVYSAFKCRNSFPAMPNGTSCATMWARVAPTGRSCHFMRAHTTTKRDCDKSEPNEDESIRFSPQSERKNGEKILQPAANDCLVCLRRAERVVTKPKCFQLKEDKCIHVYLRRLMYVDMINDLKWAPARVSERKEQNEYRTNYGHI